jgi:hypothetical protein
LQYLKMLLYHNVNALIVHFNLAKVRQVEGLKEGHDVAFKRECDGLLLVGIAIL